MRQAQNVIWRSVACLVIGAGLFVFAPFAKAQNIGTIPVEARIQNIAGFTHIGDLTWNRAGGGMTAVFRFRPGWEHLDDHYDFRWVQIVKRYEGDVRWNFWFNPEANAWQQLPAPFVDPAAGGWQYQYAGGRNPTNRQDYDGADYSPYYENDDDGDKYWFASFSGDYFDPNDPTETIPHRDTGSTKVHIERQFSTFMDFPRKGPGARVTFQTYLVVTQHTRNFFDRAFGNTWRFGKLVAFEWVITFDEQARPTITSVTPRTRRDLNAKKDALNDALRKGFQNWRSIQPDGFELVPEPASMLALAVGLAGLAYRRRRRTA